MSLLLPLRAFSDPRAAARRWTDPHADHPALLMLPTSMQKKPKQTKNNNKKTQKTPNPTRKQGHSSKLYFQPYLLPALFPQLQLPVHGASLHPSSLHLPGENTPHPGDCPLHGAEHGCRCPWLMQVCQTSQDLSLFPIKGSSTGCNFSIQAIATTDSRCMTSKGHTALLDRGRGNPLIWEPG